ncbi:MAG: head GIN domain-containing protein [Ferruginibacter sp.]
MLKYLIFTCIICVNFSCNYSSGSGNIVTEKRNVGSFHGISASQGFDVEVSIGSNNEVTIEADDNLMHSVETSVNSGVLKISLDKHNVSNAHLKAFITATSIDILKASSSASIIMKNELNYTGNVKLETSSAGNITSVINAPSVEADASSGSEINIRGRTKDLDAQSSSGASIKAFDLLSENTKASGSSGASLQVHASVNLNASASSGANISYRGGANIKKSVSSGGEVHKE